MKTISLLSYLQRVACVSLYWSRLIDTATATPLSHSLWAHVQSVSHSESTTDSRMHRHRCIAGRCSSLVCCLTSPCSLRPPSMCAITLDPVMCWVDSPGVHVWCCPLGSLHACAVSVFRAVFVPLSRAAPDKTRVITTTIGPYVYTLAPWGPHGLLCMIRHCRAPGLPVSLSGYSVTTLGVDPDSALRGISDKLVDPLPYCQSCIPV